MRTRRGTARRGRPPHQSREQRPTWPEGRCAGAGLGRQRIQGQLVALVLGAGTERLCLSPGSRAVDIAAVDEKPGHPEPLQVGDIARVERPTDLARDKVSPDDDIADAQRVFGHDLQVQPAARRVVRRGRLGTGHSPVECRGRLTSRPLEPSTYWATTVQSDEYGTGRTVGQVTVVASGTRTNGARQVSASDPDSCSRGSRRVTSRAGPGQHDERAGRGGRRLLRPGGVRARATTRRAGQRP